MAAELCRVSLWLEALEPGKPLSFLDHHIRVGNSLLGTTPDLIAGGLPDAAFNPIEGDDKNICSALKKGNKKERQSVHQQTRLHLMVAEPQEEYNRIGANSRNIEKAPDDTLEEIKNKADQFRRLVVSPEYQHAQLVADAWCAAFVCIKRADAIAEPITTDTIRRLLTDPETLTSAQKHAVENLSQKYQFFQWHLAFPEVFDRGGFDCVLGNPPWERLKLQEKEFFAARNPEIANAPNAAARHRMIAELPEADPALYQAFRNALRQADGESRLVRNTGRYPLCGRGDVNTYAIFAELKRGLLNPSGRVGCIVPSGIATDDTTKFFFQDLMDRGSLVRLYSFENEEFIFPSIHHATKFCLLTMASPALALQRMVDFVFFTRQVEHLAEKERHFTLTADDIALLNPNTRTCPIFRHKKDAELTKYVYQRVPVLVREPRDGEPEENPWGIKFATMFHMANDSGLFRTKGQLEAEESVLSGNVFTRGEDVYLPLYEGKMFWHFDHRFGTYQGQTEAQANQGKLPELSPEQHAHPDFPSLPRYWVSEKDVRTKIPKRPELLASAIGLPERWRREAIIKTFCYWSAGYWRKAGDEEQAKRLLALALDPSLAHSEIDVLNQWLLDEQCEKMQEKYPLTEADVERMTGSPEDPIPLAEELLERFAPHWLVAFRNVTSAVVLRTAVFSIIPKIAVGHSAPLLFIEKNPTKMCCILAAINSFALDYVMRQSIGGSNMSYFILKQLPVISSDDVLMSCPWSKESSVEHWIVPRVMELSYTAWDLRAFGADCGYEGPPFQWDEERRQIIRCELDAAFFHLYLGNENDWSGKGSKELLAYFPTPRHATEYILDTFRILRERDEAACGTYRTKDTILEIYDQMVRVMAENAMAVTAGAQPTAHYQTRLNPPPGPPMDADGNFLSMADWNRANWPSHIHLPKAEAIEKPLEVPLEEFVPPFYPATETDRAVCAAALTIIEQSQNISSVDHLDTLLIATHPDWCNIFLDQSVHQAFETVRSATPGSLFVAMDQSIKWKESRDYLEQQQAISVDHGNRGQAMNVGVNLNVVKSGLPGNINEIVKYALLAMKRVKELREDLSQIPQEQVQIIRAMDQQRILYQLAA
ncbi:MAG: hypothetical protein A4E65_00054 [Syntrophorhabdus sp. PtaU1.Bin153]|nr:MAG: hypothetical protein A4E65_00054 [Syntrophorhabdus sp. PtaU1.Bin153]